MNSFTSRFLGLAAVGLFAAACAGDGDISGLSRTSAVADLAGDLPPSVVTLCKIGPVGTNATLSVSATGGSLLLGSEVTLDASDLGDPAGCVEVRRSVEPQPDPDVVQTVTVTEIGMTPGTQLDYIVTISGLGGTAEYFPPVNSASLAVNYANGGIMFFRNSGVPTIGKGGCTPGFWRQEHHYAYWTAPYAPGSAFSSVFADAFPGMTLGEVVQIGGGGLSALGRHTVAALLNAASPEVDYGMTPAEVIAAFNSAFAAGNFEEQKNIFEGLNERGCAVDKSGQSGKKRK